MSLNNEKRTENNQIIVTVDLENQVREDKAHPENDPGIVIYYRIRVDEEHYEVKNRHMKGRAIIALTGKDPEHYVLEQRVKEGGEMKFVEVGANETVDFSAKGIERFITKPKPKIYHFYIGQKEYKTEHSTLAVRQILVDFAKVQDPATKTLAIKTDSGFREYTNLDEIVPLDGCPHFALFDNSSLPVS